MTTQPMVGWLRDDEAFVANLRQGLAVEALAALELVLAGLAVRWVRPEIVEPEEQRAGQLADEPDLLVAVHLRLEVKYRDVRFTGPADYPYPTAFVGRRSRWDKRAQTPLAILLVSRPTGAVVVVPGSTRPRWTTVEAYDRITRRDETSYACPRELLRELGTLVDHLRAVDGWRAP